MRGFVLAIALCAIACLAAPSAVQAQHCGFGGVQGQAFGGQFFPQAVGGQVVQLANGQLVQVLANGQVIPLTNPTFAAQGVIGFAAPPVHVNPFGVQFQTRTVQRQGFFGRPISRTTTVTRF